MTVYSSNAIRPVAGNTYVPDSMEARGKIRPIAPVAPNVRNGEGLLIGMGLAMFEWSFNTMTQTELEWWKTLIGHVSNSQNPTFSKRFVTTSLPAARLWDISGTMTDYQVAVIDMPTWEDYKNGRYQNVVVRFSSLIPGP